MKYGFCALVLMVASIASPAWGQQVRRTFVSGKGSDTGNCSLVAPCRSFQYALSQTQSGGEVMALDTAGYGAVNILRAVMITAPTGIVAVATAAGAGQNAIYVGNAVPFRLEGLTLDGALYVDSVPGNQLSTGSIVRCTIRSGGVQLPNGGTYEITDSSIADGLTMNVVRTLYSNTTILRTRVSGQTSFSNSVSGANFGTMRIFDSHLGNFSVTGGAGSSSTIRMVRTSAALFTLQQNSVAYLTASSIDKLTIQDAAVANSFGNNDIITVSGNLQTIPLR